MQAACEQKQLVYADVLQELENATKDSALPGALNATEWKIDFLIDYIINVHHAYLHKVLPALEVALLSFLNSHRKNHPELE